jgi:hypothetical protein
VRFSRSTVLTIVVLCLAGFVVLYAFTLSRYRLQGTTRAADFEAGDRANPDRVEVHVRLQSFDPARGDLGVRVEIDPEGALQSDDGLTPRRDLRLLINSNSGQREFLFRAGALASPVETTIELFGGSVNDYPFDRHQATLGILIGTGAPGDAWDERTRVPVAVAFRGALYGVQVEASPDLGTVVSGVVIEMSFRRAGTVLFFAVLVMAVMWALCLSVLIQSLLLLSGRRKIEPTMFGYMAAMLFAFPALRNSLPGVPPYGGLIDFLAFFWAEGIVALSLLFGLLAWIARPYK